MENRVTRGLILVINKQPQDNCSDGSTHKLSLISQITSEPVTSKAYCRICSRKAIAADHVPVTDAEVINCKNYAVLDAELGREIVDCFIYTEEGCSSEDGNHTLVNLNEDWPDTGELGENAVCSSCGRKAETKRDRFRRRGISTKPIKWFGLDGSVVDTNDKDCLEGHPEHLLQGAGDWKKRCAFAQGACCGNCHRPSVLVKRRG